MKKIKLLFCGTLLSILLVGNVFAADVNYNSAFSFLNGALSAILSVFTDPCEGRICTTCKPGSGGESGDTCRPNSN